MKQHLPALAHARDKFRADNRLDPHIYVPKHTEAAIVSSFREPEFCLENLLTGKRIPLVHKQVLIGRNPNLHIHINDLSLANKHAYIEINDSFSKAFLKDLGALHGCYINDIKVPSNGKRHIHHLDVLRFGNAAE